MMQLQIFDTPDLLAQATADKIHNIVHNKPDALLCIASGDTPLLTNQYIVKGAVQRAIDFSKVHFISLDEWVGVPPTNSGSCYYFLNKTIFTPLNITPDRIHFFDALAEDLDAECSRINDMVTKRGGIDMILVGVGMNGHIGFNEPGINPDLHAHVIELDATTLQVGQKYFSETTPIQKGITLGIKQFLNARLAILLASGLKKAGVVQKALTLPVSVDIPASYIQEHSNGYAMLDKEAGNLLKK